MTTDPMLEVTTPDITVIVPVYRNVDDVAACLGSVLGHATAGVPFDLLVIDDASPEHDVLTWLDAFAEGEHPVPVTVLHNPTNLGFVGTVNRGLRRAEGDVVVLNADTVVTAGWLERLAAVAAEPEVASVTPLSNFGSICTLPAAVIDAFDLAGTSPDIDGCGAFVAAHGLGLHPEVITGVGFCLYLTRGALDRVGMLDEETFGKGYGEEVDFCLRATRLGFRHLVDDTTFVYHRGGGSFGAEGRAQGKARGSARLHRRYPFLRSAIRADRRRAPLAVSFAALEASLAPRRTDRLHVMHVLHSPPDALGGTEQHVLSLIDALWGDVDASIFYHVPSGFVVRTVWADADGRPITREHLLPGASRKIQTVFDMVAAEAMATALDLFSPDAVHIQNLVGHSLAPLAALEGFRGPVVCSVRDLYLACPNHWLLTPDLDPCGIPEDPTVCASCLPFTRGLDIDQLDRFRGIVREHLDVVDTWVVASRSAGDFLQRAYEIPDERIEVIPHGALVDLAERRTVTDEDVITSDPLRVAFVGVGWPKKGLDVVNEVAEHVAGEQIEIHHFGKAKAAIGPTVICHGRYQNTDLPRLLDDAGVAVVLLPAPYAETFGHVLTEALLAGRPVIGTGYGALGERIRQHGIGWTVDPQDPDAIVDLLRNLAHNRDEVRRAADATLVVPVPSVAETASAYADRYRTRLAPHPIPDGGSTVTTEDERLRRQLRAMAAVNQQLHDQIADTGVGGSTAPATLPVPGPEASDGAATTSSRETDLPAMTQSTGSGATPHLTRRSDGVVFLVDADGRRKVRSGLIATALGAAFGAPRPEGDDAYGSKGDVPDLELLRGSSGEAFIVIDGSRRALKGLPVPRTLTSAEVERFPVGPPIDLGRSVVARSASSAGGSGLKAELARIVRGAKRRLRG